MARWQYSKIRTQFVLRELRRSRWEDRGYIHTLMLIEDMYAKDGARGMGASMWLCAVSQKYPAAVHAIRSELVEGKALSDEELLAWMAERQRDEERKRREWEEGERRRREQELEDERLNREEWLAMGGLP